MNQGKRFKQLPECHSKIRANTMLSWPETWMQSASIPSALIKGRRGADGRAISAAVVPCMAAISSTVLSTPMRSRLREEISIKEAASIVRSKDCQISIQIVDAAR